jgi:hypothetical protein
MTEPTNQTHSKPAPSRPPGDARYLALVAGLLIIIIGVLAALWQRERVAGRAAMQELAELRAEQKRLKLANQIMLSEQTGRIEPLARSEWTLGEVTLNGESRPAFFLEPSAARRLGLARGDIAIVQPAPSDANAPAADANTPTSGG